MRRCLSKSMCTAPKCLSLRRDSSVRLVEKVTHLGTSGALQNFAQPAANDQIFAGLQHPPPYDDGVFSTRQSGAGRSTSSAGVEFDSRFTLAHLLHDFLSGGSDASGIVGHE